jgi:hypothetical protein
MLILVKSKHGGSSGMRSWNYQKWFSMSSHMDFHSGSLSMREQERELYCGLGISLFFIGSPGCLFSYEAARSSLFPLPYDLLYP